MGLVTAHTAVSAPPETVWAYVIDPDNFAAYVEGYEGGQVAGDKPTGIGARYEWVGRAGPLRIAAREEVVEWQEGRRVGYRGRAAGASFDSAMEVNPDGTGGTRLRVEIAYRLPARLGGRIADILVARWLIRSHIERSLRRLEESFG